MSVVPFRVSCSISVVKPRPWRILLASTGVDMISLCTPRTFPPSTLPPSFVSLVHLLLHLLPCRAPFAGWMMILFTPPSLAACLLIPAPPALRR